MKKYAEYDKVAKAIKEEIAEKMKDETNLDLFSEGYKKGFADGFDAAFKQIETIYIKQMEEEGVQPISWPKIWP